MKKLVEIDENEGLESLLGKTVLLMCATYFYTGELVGVNDSCVKLKKPKIVYDTGEWTDEKWSDAQSMEVEFFYIQISFIESFGESK